MEATMRAGELLVRRVQRPTRHQSGFTYIAVLVAMLLVSLGTQGVMTYVSQQALREREADLLRIGYAYVQAIGTYYEATPGSLKRWPRKLEDLTEDRRLVTVRRYLREIYPDPIMRSANWGIVVAPDGGIAGIHSLSDAAPIRTAGTDLGGMTLAAASRYSDWKFVFEATARPTQSGVRK